MAAPVWGSLAGDLGSIQEAEFYNFQLVCSDPDVHTPGDPLNEDGDQGIIFTLQSGFLPTGVRLTRSGKCEGLPSCEIYVSGVPSNVGQNVTSRFVVRAESSDGIVDDRTFELTVVGQDAPVILSAAGLLGTYRDGNYISHQILATDADPDDTLTFSVLSGELPLGTSLSNDGLLTGYIAPAATLTGTPGFDTNNVGFDVNSFDFRTIGQDKNYEFTITVFDGKAYVAQTYTIFVYSGNTLTVDNSVPTADMVNVFPWTADQSTLRPPVLLTPEQDLGNITHDNYFAYQFFGADFDGDTLEYSLGVGSEQGFDNDSGFDTEINGFDQGGLAIPPGLTLDTATGWLYGYIPNQVAVTTDYTFTVRTYKRDDPTFNSGWKFFDMTIVGDVVSIVTWLTDATLGSIAAGEISTINISTTNTLNRTVQYRLKPGSNSKLPQGLQLQADGLIVGRPTFKTFMLDGGTTTIDRDHPVLDETTFELTYTFTVNVYDGGSGDISAFKDFTIILDPRNFKPYENLWVKAYPSADQRAIWESLIDSPDDFPPEKIYRESDYYFGKQQDMRLIVSTGLDPQEASKYVEAMSTNHYSKHVTIGELKKARAVIGSDTVYEVVYADVIDENINALRESTSSSIDFIAPHGPTWSNPLTVDKTSITSDTDVITADSEDTYVFYPNSFENMNDKMISEIAQIELESLPLWMRSKQENGSILGFQPAVIVAYVTPGNADEIIFNINRRTDIDLKQIEFRFDRYIWDTDMSVNWDKTTDPAGWTAETETTYDLLSTVYDETIIDGGSTRFLSDSFVYKSTRDDGDSFLKFPAVTIER